MRCLIAVVLAGLAQAAQPLPRLDGKTLLVDGKPFVILGAQLHNSSGWPGTFERAWGRIEELSANTIEVPVYWEAVEPEPGRYDWTNVDTIVRGARERNLKAILLWFASWKNGYLDYAPGWVKRDPTRYARAVDAGGQAMRSLSPHCAPCREADARAFAAFMAHLREIDSEHRTVILVQVENEPGLRQVPGTAGTSTFRDHSPAANQAFASETVPQALGKKGTWSSVFGEDAAESFTAWHIASYVNAVARAGKREYSLPMYANVWLRENGHMRPGEDYPSGGPTSNVLGIWKAAAPDLDLIAPDIYHENSEVYRSICEQYSRPDNALMIPENGQAAGFGKNLFYALGDLKAIGFAPFGVDEVGAMPEGLARIAQAFRLLRPAVEPLAQWQRSGKLWSVVAEPGVREKLYRFGRYDVLAAFGPNGRALVAELGPDEFYAAGFDVRLVFRPRRGEPGFRTQFVSLEEGTFERGVWKAHRLLNGDETEPGLILPVTGAILHARVMSY